MDDKNKIDDVLKELLVKIEKIKTEKVASKPINNHSNYLGSVISEFASPFILIGYDITGGYFQLVNCQSQKEHDSLCMALDRCKAVGFNSNIDIEDFGEDEY